MLALDSTYQVAESLLKAMDTASDLVVTPDGTDMVELTSLHDGVTSAYHRTAYAASTIGTPQGQGNKRNMQQQTCYSPSTNTVLISKSLSIEQPYLETSPTTSMKGVMQTSAGTRPNRRGSVIGGGIMTAGLLGESDDMEVGSTIPSSLSQMTEHKEEEKEEGLLPNSYQRTRANKPAQSGATNRSLSANTTQTQIKHRIKHYSPNVIPIVKSKRNMVIVGAVLKSDLQHSLIELKRVIEIANTPPVRFCRIIYLYIHNILLN